MLCKTVYRISYSILFRYFLWPSVLNPHSGQGHTDEVKTPIPIEIWNYTDGNWTKSSQKPELSRPHVTKRASNRHLDSPSSTFAISTVKMTANSNQRPLPCPALVDKIPDLAADFGRNREWEHQAATSMECGRSILFDHTVCCKTNFTRRERNRKTLRATNDIPNTAGGSLATFYYLSNVYLFSCRIYLPTRSSSAYRGPRTNNGSF
jgi:hypothetical protein